jgi:hypothetical protein
MNNIIYNTYAEVLVFKTNICTDSEVALVGELLADENIVKWNVDRDDIDNVLRIECDHVNPFTVIHRLRAVGFECEELPD